MNPPANGEEAEDEFGGDDDESENESDGYNTQPASDEEAENESGGDDAQPADDEESDYEC